MKGLDVCPKCGAKDVKLLGHCRICLQTVCSSCGNLQVASGKDTICAHSGCLVNNLNSLKTSFRFVKLRGT